MISILSMSHNIFVLNFWSIVDKKALPVSGATWTRSSQTSSFFLCAYLRVHSPNNSTKSPATFHVNGGLNVEGEQIQSSLSNIGEGRTGMHFSCEIMLSQLIA